MAIQVRLDLTPAEFDLARRALDAYHTAKIAESEETTRLDATDAIGRSEARRKARAEALLTKDLIGKLNG
jgi:hypothetical protein